MDCRAYEMMISAYVDKELEKQELIALEEHLKNCAECRKSLEDLLEIKAAIKRDLEETKLKPVKNNIIYRSIFRYFYFLFIILIAAFSVIAIAGGVVQQYIDGFPKNVRIIFLAGIGFILAGIFVMLYDILKELVKIFTKFNKKKTSNE